MIVSSTCVSLRCHLTPSVLAPHKVFFLSNLIGVRGLNSVCTRQPCSPCWLFRLNRDKAILNDSRSHDLRIYEEVVATYQFSRRAVWFTTLQPGWMPSGVATVGTQLSFIVGDVNLGTSIADVVKSTYPCPAV